MRNLTWVLSADGASFVLGIIRVVLLSHLLGAEQFGVLALVIASTTTVNKVVDFRVWETTVKYLSDFWNRGDKARAVSVIKGSYLLDLGSGMIAFLFVVLMAPLFATYVIKDPNSINTVRLYGLVLLVGTIDGTSNAILRVFDRFAWLSWHRGITALVMLGATAFALTVSRDVTVIVAFYLIGQIFLSLALTSLAGVIIHREFSGFYWKGKLKLLADHSEDMKSLLIQTNVTAVLKMVLVSLDELLLGYFRSPVEVGQYHLIKIIISPIRRLNAPVYQVAYPEVVRLAVGGGRRALQEYIWHLTLFMGGLLIPVGVAIFLAASWLLVVFGGEEYVSTQAVLAVRLMVIGEVCLLTLVWPRPLMVGVGKVQMMNWVFGASVVIWLVAAPLILPAVGLVGAAVLYCLTSMGQAGMFVYLLQGSLRRMTVNIG